MLLRCNSHRLRYKQKEIDTKLDNILTDEQKKQLKEMKENAGRGGPNGRGPAGRGGPPPEGPPQS